DILRLYGFHILSAEILHPFTPLSFLSRPKYHSLLCLSTPDHAAVPVHTEKDASAQAGHAEIGASQRVEGHIGRCHRADSYVHADIPDDLQGEKQRPRKGQQKAETVSLSENNAEKKRQEQSGRQRQQ